jgi:hypothetical protein
MTSKLAVRGKRADTLGCIAGDRLDCQRRVNPAGGREYGTIADPEVADIPTSAVRIDNAPMRAVPLR